MSDTKRRLIAQALPPLVLGDFPLTGGRRLEPFPRLARLLWLAAALSLPVLGLTCADLVHRVGRPGAMQAAAPAIPSAGAAVLLGAAWTRRDVQVTSPLLTRRENRV